MRLRGDWLARACLVPDQVLVTNTSHVCIPGSQFMIIFNQLGWDKRRRRVGTFEFVLGAKGAHKQVLWSIFIFRGDYLLNTVLVLAFWDFYQSIL